MKTVQYITYLLIASFAMSCSNSSTKTAQTVELQSTTTAINFTPEQIERAHIVVGTADSMQLYYETSCFGRTQLPPSNTISIHFKSEAYIENILVLPGDLVAKNQLLATVQHPNIIALQQDFLVASNQLDYLKKELDRKSPLLETKAVSLKDFNALQNEFNQAKVAFNALENQLKLLGINSTNVLENGIQNLCSIYAPEEGIVESVNGNKGALIQPNQALFNLLNTNNMLVELSVFSNDLHHISIGDSVLLNSQNGTYKGSVHSVSKNLIPENGSGLVLVKFNNANESSNLKVGESVQATVFSQPQIGLTLPREAVLKQGDEYFAYQQTPNGFEQIPLQVTRTSKEFVQFTPTEFATSTTKFARSGAYYLAGTSPNEE